MKHALGQYLLYSRCICFFRKTATCCGNAKTHLRSAETSKNGYLQDTNRSAETTWAKNTHNTFQLLPFQELLRRIKLNCVRKQKRNTTLQGCTNGYQAILFLGVCVATQSTINSSSTQACPKLPQATKPKMIAKD